MDSQVSGGSASSTRSIKTFFLAIAVTVAALALPGVAQAATFNPIADSYVNSANPGNNFGTVTTLETDGVPIKRTYMRFDVQGVGSISSARLWMFATIDNPTGFQLHSVSDNSWSETGINWSNAPAIGPAIASSGPVVAGNWYSVNVSSLVSGDGLVSFALSSLSSSSLNYTSREGGNPPQLVAPAPTPPTGYTITRTGTTYDAIPTPSGTPYAGSLKQVLDSASRALDGPAGGTITFGADTYDFGAEFFEAHDLHNITFQGQGMDDTIIQNDTGVIAKDTEPFDFGRTYGVTIRDLQVRAGGSPRTTSDAIDFDGGNDTLIERVKITQSRSRGIVFDGKDIDGVTGRTSLNNVARDCVIDGVPSDGIELLATQNSRVEGCSITNVGGDGVQMTKSSTISNQPNKKPNDNVIRNNYIENAGIDGIDILSGDGNQIVGNTILNSSNVATSRAGIRIESGDSVACDDNLVSGNSANDNQTPKTQRFGLHIVGPDCNRTLVYTTHNDFTGNVSAAIQDLGTDTQYLPAHDVPAAADTMHVALVPNFRQTINATGCTARGGASGSHGPPLSFLSCNPPAQLPGTQAHFGDQATGAADITLVPGDADPTNGDQADLALSLIASDVRLNDATGADYDPVASGPDMAAAAKIRISDDYNETSGQACAVSKVCPATSTGIEFAVPVACTATVSATVGSDCSVNTSADAVTPGLATELKGAAIQVYRIRLRDAGADSILDNADDRDAFMQGIYIP